MDRREQSADKHSHEQSQIEVCGCHGGRESGKGTHEHGTLHAEVEDTGLFGIDFTECRIGE